MNLINAYDFGARSYSIRGMHLPIVSHFNVIVYDV